MARRNPSRLHDLAIDGKRDELQEFLSWDGAASKVNERDAYKFTPLHLAADRGELHPGYARPDVR